MQSIYAVFHEHDILDVIGPFVVRASSDHYQLIQDLQDPQSKTTNCNERLFFLFFKFAIVQQMAIPIGIAAHAQWKNYTNEVQVFLH